MLLKRKTTGCLSSEYYKLYSAANVDDSTRFDSNWTTRHSKWRSLIPDVDLQRKTWTSHVLKARNDCKSFFRIFWTIQCRKCWRFDTIRLESSDSPQQMTIRRTGCRFAEEDMVDGSSFVMTSRSIRQHLQPPFTDTCVVFSKCLKIDIRYDWWSFVVTSRSIRVESCRFDNIYNPLHRHLRNIL